MVGIAFFHPVATLQPPPDAGFLVSSDAPTGAAGWGDQCKRLKSLDLSKASPHPRRGEAFSCFFLFLSDFLSILPPRERMRRNYKRLHVFIYAKLL